MESGQFKLLINSNIYKKLYIAMAVLVFAHIVYLFIFLKIGDFRLIFVSIVSIILYILLAIILKGEQNAKMSLIATQIQIFIHAFTSLCILGFGYGFENIIIMLIAVVFFTNSSNRLLGYVLALIQVSVLSLVYVKFNFEPLNEDAKFIYIFNFILLVFLLIFFSMLVRIFNAMIYLNMLDKQDALEMAANKDLLTGLYNRRAFENIISDAIIKSNQNISVIMGDLDNFKMINDKFGHDAGDETLKEVAKIIKNSLRKQDYACRFGGEEFLIIITNINFQTSELILNRIKDKISSHIFKFGDNNAKISITFGFINTLVADKSELNLAIKRADELMYKGKRSGKNCIFGEVLNQDLAKN